MALSERIKKNLSYIRIYSIKIFKGIQRSIVFPKRNLLQAISFSVVVFVLVYLELGIFNIPSVIFLGKDIIPDNQILAITNDTVLDDTITSPANGSVAIAQGASSTNNKNFFVPNILNISQGMTVKWTNGDLISYKSFEVEQIHTVMSGNIDKGNMGKEFDSGFLSAGKSFEHTFNSKGTYDYFCFIHPFMTGKVVVS